jgi:hypothetical protein
MDNSDLYGVMMLVGCPVSIWLIILFVRLCGRVKAIEKMLMAAFELEEFSDYGPFGGRHFRRKRLGSQALSERNT